MTAALAAYVLLGSLTAPAEPLWVDLGPTNNGYGLSVPSKGDGDNVAAEVDGVACRRISTPGSLYLYVAVDKGLLPPGRYGLYVTVEFLDERLGNVAVQYDRAGGAAYAESEGGFLTLGTGAWQRQTVRLPDAGLGGRENHGTDFRLNTGDLAVRRIELRTSASDDYEPGGYDRAALEAVRVHIGEGMELTVGADVGPAQAALFRALGATSIETYVTWQTVEDAGEGQWDWSRWDRQVEVLEEAGLKWVPFLIAGPAYANPKWFRESDQSVAYVCLEHGQPSKVQSLWSPHLRPWIERFLHAFAERYRDRGVIESVLLGVTGIYGESIYPAGPEGGWTADIPGPYHNHMGWWAGDEYARAAFREAMRTKYPAVSDLNAAWGTAHASFDDVTTFVPEKAPSLRARLDMVDWYMATMTDWAAWWVGATRECFPTSEIYLCTGGDGNAMLGADFSAQALAIEPYGAGIRITNEGSDYAGNFVVTREVGTACRAFGTFFGYEPASTVDANGVIARIFGATGAGARQLHYYGGNLTDTVQATRNFREYASFVAPRTPTIHAGIYLPKTSWAADEGNIGATYQAAARVRDVLDVEFLDRTTMGSALAEGIVALAVAGAPYAERQEAERLRQWVESGHILVGLPTRDGGLLATPEGDTSVPDGLFVPEPPAGSLETLGLDVDAPGASALHVGAPDDDRALLGQWHGRETGPEWPAIAGATKRWSGARCGFLLPVRPGEPATLTLSAMLTEHSLNGPNRVLVNGQPVGDLTEAGTHDFRFAVPAQVIGASPVARVELEITTWRPSDHGMDDGRDLGLAVRLVEVRADGYEGPAVADVGIRRTLNEATLLATCVRRVGKGATVLLPPSAASDGVLGQVLALAVEHPERFAPGLVGAPLPYPVVDRVFVSQVEEGILAYNGGDAARTLGGAEVLAHGLMLLPSP